jgi:ketosteroid isomerase-like protein
MAALPTFNDPGDVDAIRAIEVELSVQLNVPDIVKLYAPNALLADFMSDSVFNGRVAIGKHFDEVVRGLESLDPDMIDLDVVSDGTLAFAAVQVHLAAATADGGIRHATFRELDAFRKIEGTWLIVQSHASLPFDAQTAAPVLNGPLPARGPLDWVNKPPPGPATTPALGIAEAWRWAETVSQIQHVDELLPFYGPQDEFQTYEIFHPGVLRGRQEFCDAHVSLDVSVRRLFPDMKRMEIKKPMFVVDSDGLLAAQFGIQELVITLQDESVRKLYLRRSDCLRRVDNTWRSCFSMASFAADLFTERVATRTVNPLRSR